MSRLIEIATQIAKSVNADESEWFPELAVAEEDIVLPTVDEQLSAYYRAELIRANTFLDKRKDDVFNSVLSLDTRGQVERALKAYTQEYILGLGLSMDATAELAQSLIQVAKKYPVSIPKAWSDIASMKVDLEDDEEFAPRRTVQM